MTGDDDDMNQIAHPLQQLCSRHVDQAAPPPIVIMISSSPSNARLLISVFVASCVASLQSTDAFTLSKESSSIINAPRRINTELYNLFDAVGDILSGPKLDAENALPYHPPFCDELSICDDGVRTFAIKERPLSFTGEDFDITEVTNNNEEDFVRVRGAMLHLPGKDKMRMVSSSSGDNLVTMDRVLIAATPSYDLYRSDGTKIGWIEKKLISFMDTFDVYMEGKGGFGVTGLFKPTPAYRIEGDFLDRNFSFKNEEGKIVARANMDGWVQIDMMNHYQVQVAEGMDACLVLACVCCIDEEFDEEHQERKKKRED